MANQPNQGQPAQQGQQNQPQNQQHDQTLQHLGVNQQDLQSRGIQPSAFIGLLQQLVPVLLNWLASNAGAVSASGQKQP